MPLRASSLTLLAVLAAGLALGGGAAEGYVATGRPWPGGVITYYNAARDQAWAVQRAVDAWNSSGARVRFVAASAARAQVRIDHFPRVPCTINAQATVGYTKQARVYVFQLNQRSPYCNSYMAAQSIAHELGHVLGLDHEIRGCSLMNPTGSLQGPGLCSKAQLWQWRCRLLTPDDVAGAIALYGGTARAQRGPLDCDLYEGSRAPTKLAVAWTGTPQQVRVSFRRPPSVGVLDFLSVQRRQPEAFAATATTGRCATDMTTATRYRWSAKSGGTQSTSMTLAEGTYCVAVWAIDSFGRPSSPGWLWIRV